MKPQDESKVRREVKCPCGYRFWTRKPIETDVQCSQCKKRN